MLQTYLISYSCIHKYNFILILREASEMDPRCMFATNNSSLVLMGQETCSSAAPCARMGYEFSSNNMTFQLPAILRAEHPGEADFLICKAISQHPVFFLFFFAAYMWEWCSCIQNHGKALVLFTDFLHVTFLTTNGTKNKNSYVLWVKGAHQWWNGQKSWGPCLCTPTVLLPYLGVNRLKMYS